MIRLLTFVLFLSLPNFSFANEIRLVEKFFSKNGVGNKKDVYAGEMLSFIDNPTLGETLPSRSKVKIRLLDSSNKRKIYAVFLSVDEKYKDFYIFMLKEGNQWKISAVRKLALPRFFSVNMEYLKTKDA